MENLLFDFILMRAYMPIAIIVAIICIIWNVHCMFVTYKLYRFNCVTCALYFVMVGLVKVDAIVIFVVPLIPVQYIVLGS